VPRHHAASYASDQAPAAVEMLAVDVLAFDPDRSATQTERGERPSTVTHARSPQLGHEERSSSENHLRKSLFVGYGRLFRDSGASVGRLSLVWLASGLALHPAWWRRSRRRAGQRDDRMGLARLSK
jgi:hypothetical protein